ncbi:MAG: 2-hydroxychromene-2-carboxylate isomerase [Hyphomicrobiaceae bacterium]
MPKPRIEFWYDFASTYSWLSAIRVEALTRNVDCDIAWRPFLLGPIFKAQGWTTSPFNLYPAKGRYMVRDIARIADARGLVFVMPDPFPANSLTAGRLAIAVGNDHIGDFTRRVYEVQFETGADISQRGTLEPILQAMGLDVTAMIAASETTAVKDTLRNNTAEAQSLGIFGAPTFVTADGELFWGDDRLEQACAWAHKAERA